MPAPASASVSAPVGRPNALTAVKREVLPDAVRITLELGQEVNFRSDRLDGPPRVFIDFDNTRPVEAIKDATIPFPDDVVRKVRIGRQTETRYAGRHGSLRCRTTQHLHAVQPLPRRDRLRARDRSRHPRSSRRQQPTSACRAADRLPDPDGSHPGSRGRAACQPRLLLGSPRTTMRQQAYQWQVRRHPHHRRSTDQEDFLCHGSSGCGCRES